MSWIPPILITERLKLAAPTDTGQVRFAPERRPESERDLPGLPSNWAIFLKTSEAAIGSIGYMRWDRVARIAELGFILDAPHRNQGLMTEAGRAVIAFGFEGMALASVETRSFPHNLASIRVFEKLGMKQIDGVKAQVFLQGEAVDLWVYRIGNPER